MSRLIVEATDALSHLDVRALEELRRRAEALAGLDLGSAGVSNQAIKPVLEHRFKLFSALLRQTEDNLATLRRAKSLQSSYEPTFGDQPFGRQGYAAKESLPYHPSISQRDLPPSGLFESFGLYSEEEPNDSIWPRGRMAQARARRDATSRKPADKTGPGRA